VPPLTTWRPDEADVRWWSFKEGKTDGDFSF
jgi:hypothetical protein